MKFHYRLPVKLLALFLLLIFLTGACLSFYGVLCCADVNAFDNSADYLDSYAMHRACNTYTIRVGNLLNLFCDDTPWTIDSQESLETMRSLFSSQNTNVRVVLEDPQSGGTLELDRLLNLPDDRDPNRGEQLLRTDSYTISVSGGVLGRWLNVDAKFTERRAQAQRIMEDQAKALEELKRRQDSEPNSSFSEYDYATDYGANSSPDYSEYTDGTAEENDSVSQYISEADSGELYYNQRTGTWFTSQEVSDEVDALELAESIEYDITAYFYVNTAFPAIDSLYHAYWQYRNLADFAYPLLGLFAACSLLGLLLWAYLMCAAGHRPDTDRDVITLRLIDRLPYDLFTAVFGSAFMLLLCVLMQLQQMDLWNYTPLLFIFAVASAFGASLAFTVFTLSTAARWKSHTLLRNTIIWRLCAWLWRILSGGAGKVVERLQPRTLSPQEEAQRQEQRTQKQEQRSQTMDRVGKGARSAFGTLSNACGAAGGMFGRGWKKFCSLFSMLPMIWKGLVLALVIAFVNILLMITTLSNHDTFYLLPLFVFDMAVLWGYASILREMVWLHNGAQKIASGDLEYRLPAEVMHWEFKSHAEALNAIRDGIDAAVEERVQAVEERIKSERMRTELLTNVSHDIKTPLTSIINYVDLLKKENIEGEQAREYLAVLDRQSIRLKKLLEDLLEASKASTGNITVNAAPTNVGELLRQVTGEYAEKLSAAGIEPILTLPAQDATIFADGRLLWRVLDNLMANIVKYAMPQTRVYLDLDSNASVTAIAVKNVSRERLNIAADELMERFVRGDSSRSTEGSGLGLSIAQSLTELMGGTFGLTIDGDLFKVELCFPTMRDIPEETAPETAPDASAVPTAPTAAPSFEKPVGKGAETLHAARKSFFPRKATLKMAMQARADAKAAKAATETETATPSELEKAVTAENLPDETEAKIVFEKTEDLAETVSGESDADTNNISDDAQTETVFEKTEDLAETVSCESDADAKNISDDAQTESVSEKAEDIPGKTETEAVPEKKVSEV